MIEFGHFFFTDRQLVDYPVGVKILVIYRVTIRKFGHQKQIGGTVDRASLASFPLNGELQF